MKLKTHIEIEVKVYADFQPYEPETLETPAVKAGFENITVFKDGYNITEMLTEEQLETIEDELWDRELDRPDMSLDSHFPDLQDSLDKLTAIGKCLNN